MGSATKQSFFLEFVVQSHGSFRHHLQLFAPPLAAELFRPCDECNHWSHHTIHQTNHIMSHTCLIRNHGFKIWLNISIIMAGDIDSIFLNSGLTPDPCFYWLIMTLGSGLCLFRSRGWGAGVRSSWGWMFQFFGFHCATINKKSSIPIIYIIYPRIGCGLFHGFGSNLVYHLLVNESLFASCSGCSLGGSLVLSTISTTIQVASASCCGGAWSSHRF